MKKQTAVEYLLEQMGLEQLMFPKEIIDKAKEMEQNQLKEMYLNGIKNYDPTFKINDEDKNIH
jgi:hypothetical protein